MDYKELIDRLKNIRFLYADNGLKCESICKDAATAIETLLAERDAAVEELRGRCSKCKHLRSGILEFPCADCCFESGKSDHWEWRGPQKESENDGQA